MDRSSLSSSQSRPRRFSAPGTRSVGSAEAGPQLRPSEVRRDPRSEIDALAARAAAGDEEAFECLHRGLGEGLRAFFRRRVGDRHDLVEELAQRTWVEAWRSLGRGHFDPNRASFATYLLGVGGKVFLRHCRTERRALNRQPAVEQWIATLLTERGLDDPTADAEQLMDLCSTLEALRDCVVRARESRRLTALDVKILDRLLAGRTEREIAIDLGIAPSTVNARKQGTLEMFRRCLASKGIR